MENSKLAALGVSIMAMRSKATEMELHKDMERFQRQLTLAMLVAQRWAKSMSPKRKTTAHPVFFERNLRCSVFRHDDIRTFNALYTD